MRIKTLFITGVTVFTLGDLLTFRPINVLAAQWHRGTPKIIRGQWYYHSKIKNQSSYITYGKYSDSNNYLAWSKYYHAFYKLPGHGLIHYSYQYLGHHNYRLHGAEGQFPSQKYTFIIKATKYNLWTDHGKFHFNRHKPHMISELKAGLHG